MPKRLHDSKTPVLTRRQLSLIFDKLPRPFTEQGRALVSLMAYSGLSFFSIRQLRMGDIVGLDIGRGQAALRFTPLSIVYPSRHKPHLIRETFLCKEGADHLLDYVGHCRASSLRPSAKLFGPTSDLYQFGYNIAATDRIVGALLGVGLIGPIWGTRFGVPSPRASGRVSNLHRIFHGYFRSRLLDLAGVPQRYVDFWNDRKEAESQISPYDFNSFQRLSDAYTAVADFVFSTTFPAQLQKYDSSSEEKTPNQGGKNRWPSNTSVTKLQTTQ